jgi:hypothetical protein
VLFEDFYYDILTSELPADLDDQALTDYFMTLREDARVLIDEAIALYRKTTLVAEQIQQRNEWIDRAQARLTFLEGYYDDEPLLRAEEAQVADLYARIRRDPANADAYRRELATRFRPLPAAPKLAPPAPNTPEASAPPAAPNPQQPNSHLPPPSLHHAPAKQPPAHDA